MDCWLVLLLMVGVFSSVVSKLRGFWIQTSIYQVFYISLTIYTKNFMFRVLTFTEGLAVCHQKRKKISQSRWPCATLNSIKRIIRQGWREIQRKILHQGWGFPASSVPWLRQEQGREDLDGGVQTGDDQEVSFQTKGFISWGNLFQQHVQGASGEHGEGSRLGWERVTRYMYVM